MRAFRSNTEPAVRRPGLRHSIEDRVWRFLSTALLVGGIGWLLADIIWKPSKRNIQVLAGVIFLGLLLVAHPFYGLIFAVITIPFPASTSVGTTSSLLIFAMAGLSLVKSRQLGLPSPFFDRKVDLSLGAFILFSLLALYPQDFSDTYQVQRFYLGILSAYVLFYLVLQLVQTRQDFVRLFNVMQVMAIILGVIANIQALFPTKTILPAFFAFSRKVASMEEVRSGQIRSFATFPGYELFAEYCAISIVLLYIAFRRAQSLAMRTFWGFGILVMIAALFRTGTRAGIIVLGFGFAYAIVMGHRAIPRSQLMRVVFVGLALFYLTLPFTYSQVDLLMSRMATLGTDDSSVQSRSEVLAEVIKELPNKPFLGHGVYQAPGTFRADVDQNIHNLYLTFAFKIGFPGLFAWLVFMWFLFRRTLHAFRDRSLPADLREYVLGFNVALVMFCLDQVKIEFVRQAITMHTTFLLLAMTLVSARIAERERA